MGDRMRLRGTLPLTAGGVERCVRMMGEQSAAGYVKWGDKKLRYK